MKNGLRLTISIIICLIFILVVYFLAGCEKEKDKNFIPFEKEVIPKVENSVKKSYKLNVEPILQLPELPTGCEVTSLTMVLNYYGYNISKEELVDNYLLYRTAEYPVGFEGSPYSTSGTLMWPPAIVDMANNFLENNESDLRGNNLSGLTLDALLEYIDKDTPVMVWINESFSTYIEYDGISCEYDGYTYRSFWGEHCIVLIGYDVEKNVVYINNPQVGEQEIDMDLFREVYDLCGRCAATIG